MWVQMIKKKVEIYCVCFMWSIRSPFIFFFMNVVGGLEQAYKALCVGPTLS